MHRHYIHIGIAGLSIHDADELKKTLQHITPDHFILQWNTASDPHLDCLLVYEYFLETEGIQRVLKNQKCPYLCISKNAQYSNQIINNTLALPLQNTQILKHWFEQNILNSEITSEIEEPIFSAPIQIQQSSDHPYTINFFKEMLHPEKGKLHLYDQHGTIAIIDSAKNLAWLNKDRAETGTDFSFQYDFASTSDLLKVTRRETQILQDWLWNFFWNSPSFAQIAPEDDHYELHYWPKPGHPLHKKRIFRYLPALFKALRFQKLLNNMRFLYSHFDNLLQPVWLQEILKKLMLGKVAIVPLSQLKELNSKVSLRAFLESYDLNLDFNKVNTYDFTTV